MAQHKSSDLDTEYPSILFRLVKTEQIGYPQKENWEQLKYYPSQSITKERLHRL